MSNKKVENEDFVVCQICNKKFKTISPPHLSKKHKISIDGYLSKFPCAKLQCDKTVRQRNQKITGRIMSSKWKSKISKSNKKSWKKNPNQGRTGHPLSEKSKKSLSEKLKNHPVSDDTKKKIGLSGLGRKPWNKGLSKENNKKIAEMSKKQCGKKVTITKETRDKISQTLKAKYAKGMPLSHTRGGIRPDLNMYFRSTWEANYARILKFLGQEILYETDRIVCYDENGKIDSVYIPDFKTKDNEYVEIKGHAKSKDNWDCNCDRCIRDKEKMDLVYQQYPNIKIDIIGKKEYAGLCEKYDFIVIEDG